MDLYRQIETWMGQKKWDKIIRAIEKIKPKGRTQDLLFILASAYIQKAQGWKDRKISKKALDILLSLGPELTRNTTWHLLVGEALEKLERLAEASQYYEDALEFVKVKTQGLPIFDLCEKARNRSDPTALTEPFSVRVSRVWEEFTKREAEFINIYDKDTEAKRRAELFEKLTVVFEIALDDVFVFMGKIGDKYQLAMTGGDDLLRLFEELYIKQRAPASVLEKWEIIVGSRPMAYDKSEAEKSDNILDDLRLWFQKGEYGLFDVDGYSETIWKPANNEAEQALNDSILSSYVAALVGEATYTKYLSSIKAVEKPVAEKSISAQEVSEFFASQGIDINAGTEAILEKMVPYKGVSQGWDDEWEFREDIIDGSSMAIKTIADFQYAEFEPFFKLEADGAIVCTLYFDNESFVGDDREEKLLNYRQAVEKELLDKAGSESVKIIGYAHGKHWEYIDLIAWNPKKVFETAEEIAKKSPVKRMIILTSGIYAPQQALKGTFPDEEKIIDLEKT